MLGWSSLIFSRRRPRTILAKRFRQPDTSGPIQRPARPGDVPRCRPLRLPVHQNAGRLESVFQAMESATFGFPAGKPSLFWRRPSTALKGCSLIRRPYRRAGRFVRVHAIQAPPPRARTVSSHAKAYSQSDGRQLVDPKAGELIGHPACGTAGFFISAAEHIRNVYRSQITADQTDAFAGAKRQRRSSTDSKSTKPCYASPPRTSCSTASIRPYVRYLDSISQNNTPSQVRRHLARTPPFKGTVDVEDIDKGLRAIVETKQTELLFVALFLRMLESAAVARASCRQRSFASAATRRRIVSFAAQLVERS